MTVGPEAAIRLANDDRRIASRNGESEAKIAWQMLFPALDRSGSPLQVQIRRMIVAAVEDRRLPAATRMPSSRDLAEMLDVARNTVVLAYQQLVDDGILVARERSGYYVADMPVPPAADAEAEGRLDEANWAARFAVRPTSYRNIIKPTDWPDYPYPFIYGQFDPGLFPTNDWRECARGALSVLEIQNWARDVIDGDDADLVEQIRSHVLPRRGVWARPDEIMITMGAQQALFLIARLFLTASSRIGIENPGYPDARNIFRLSGARVVPLPVDKQGLVPEGSFLGCDIVYTTCSHQCPTTAAMSMTRRRELLEQARSVDTILIEDDYEGELMPEGEEIPALKSIDSDGRVLYVGSLSKVLAPGLRLGYVVAPPAVIRELRALRRLMMRHPPLNNQRAAALFIGLGHYRAHLRRVAQTLAERARIIDELLPTLLRGCIAERGAGSTSFWVDAGHRIDARRLTDVARDKGVLIEPGDVFFMNAAPPRSFFRLGFSSIPTHRIEPGLARLGQSLAAARVSEADLAPARGPDWR